MKYYTHSYSTCVKTSQIGFFLNLRFRNAMDFIKYEETNKRRTLFHLSVWIIWKSSFDNRVRSKPFGSDCKKRDYRNICIALCGFKRTFEGSAILLKLLQISEFRNPLFRRKKVFL